jgi:hypothetical protein
VQTLGSRPDARLSSSKSGNLAEPTIVRSFFPETWLWEDVQTKYKLFSLLCELCCDGRAFYSILCSVILTFYRSSSGHAQVQSTSPDTITSWVLSGFAVSNETGFGVANEKPQVELNEILCLFLVFALLTSRVDDQMI